MGREWLLVSKAGMLKNTCTLEYNFGDLGMQKRKKNEVNQEIFAIILPNMTQTYVVDLEKNEHLFFIP